MKKLIIPVFFSLLFIVNITEAQTESSIDPATHIGGNTSCSAVQGSYAFLGQGSYLTVLDLNMSDMTQVAYLDLTSRPSDIFVSGNYAYLATNDFSVVDITDVMQPAIAGISGDEIGFNAKIHVANGHAFVAGDAGVFIFDVSDPSNPVTVREIPSNDFYEDIFVSGNYAYLANGTFNRLDIMDVTNPAAATFDATINIGGPTSIFVSDDVAYVTGTSGQVGLHSIDVSNPLNPVALDFFETVSGPQGNLTYHFPDQVTSDGQHAYVGCRSPFRFYAINIADPSNLALDGDVELESDFGRINNMHVMDNSVYYSVNFDVRGFREIDITTPTTPDETRDYASPRDVFWVQSHEDLMVVASQARLWVYDMTDALSPVLIASYETWGGILRLFMTETKLYGLTFDELVILDWSDPANIFEESRYQPASGTPGEIFVSGDKAYILEKGNDSTLEIIDVSDNSNPTLLGQIDLTSYAGDLFVNEENTLAFISYFRNNSTKGFIIVDVSNPSSPTILSTTATAGVPMTITVDGDTLYVGSNTGVQPNMQWHLEAFDITDKTQPAKLTELNGDGEIWDVEVEEDYIFAGIAGGSIYLIQWTPAGVVMLVIDICHSNYTRQVSISPPSASGTGYAASTEGYGGGTDTGEKDISGDDGLVVQWYFIIITGPSNCCINTAVNPKKAADDGCYTTPGCTPGGCGSEVTVTAYNVDSWVFLNWTGAVTGENEEMIATLEGHDPPGCMNSCPDWVAQANFTPWLRIGGGGQMDMCPVTDDQEILTVLNFTETASQADDWIVSEINVDISGDDEVTNHIKKVKLNYPGGSSEQDYPGGSTSLLFNTVGLIINMGETKSFSIELTLNKMTDLECPSDPKSFMVEVKNDLNTAEPLRYLPGVKQNSASTVVEVGCVRILELGEDYKYIQEGVDNASDGHTILICPGDYEENVTVPKSLTIKPRKASPETYILAKDASKPVFDLKKNDITIEDLAIQKSTQNAGILVSSAGIENTTLFKNDISGNKVGIQMGASKKMTIENNRIFNNSEHGIYATQATELNIKGTSVYSNQGYGILIETSQNIQDKPLTIENSSCRDNTMDGLRMKDVTGVVLDNNIAFNDNKISGISIENSQKIEINKTTSITGNDVSGIFLKNAREVLIDKNQVTRNKEAGIRIEDCQPDSKQTGIALTFNTIVGDRPSQTQKYGIWIKNSQYTVVGGDNKANEIRSHTDHGIFIDNAHTNELGGNSIKWNDKNGVYILNGCNNNVTGTNIIGPENGNGIGLSQCKCSSGEDNRITGAVIDNNLQDGIYLGECYNNTIGDTGEGNDIKNNKENGIYLLLCDAPFEKPNVIKANTIRNNTFHGIFLEESKGNKIIENVALEANSKDGIHLRLSSIQNDIKENKIIGNQVQANGIYIDGAIDNRIDKNDISGHVNAGIYFLDCGGGDRSHEIINNTLSDNKYGLYAQNSDDLLIGMWGLGPDHLQAPNTFEKNSDAGIRMKDCEDSNIGSNTMKQNKYGLLLEGVKFIDIFSNTIGPRNEQGLAFKNVTSGLQEPNRVYNNNILENTQNGIYMENTTGVIIGGSPDKKNTIRKNIQDGISLSNCSAGNAESNRISHNTIGDKNRHGIYLKDSKGTKIEMNEIESNRQDGISLESSHKNVIIKNPSITSNKESGIYLKWSEGNTIEGNEIYRNGGSGVYLFESKQNQVPHITKQKNIIELNGDHGIRLDNCQKNHISNNDVNKNKKHGIVINYGRSNYIGGNLTVHKNGKDGIQLNGTTLNNISGNFNRNDGNFKLGIRITSNGSVGMHFKSSPKNKINNVKVSWHNTGLYLYHSNNNVFSSNVIVSACWVGGHGVCSTNSNYGVCTYGACLRATVVTGCSEVPSSYYASNFRDLEFDGVSAYKGALPSFDRCNFENIAGLAIRNQNGSMPIDARYNWWGNPSGPGGAGPGSGSKVGANVLFEPWLTMPVGMIIQTSQDTVYVRAGQTDSIRLHFNNLVQPGDSARITVENEMGWPGFETPFSVALKDSLGSDTLLYVRPPVETPGGTINKYTIKSTSISNPLNEDSTYLYAITYLPEPQHMDIFPESVLLETGQNIRFEAQVVDQFGHSIDIPVRWLATGGQVDSTGVFSSSTSGAFTIDALSPNGLIGATAQAVVRESSILSAISIDPMVDTIGVGEDLAMSAVGFDQYGDTVTFFPVWSVDVGAIDEDGIFSSDAMGDYNVTLQDGFNQFEAHAQVHVRAASQLTYVRISPETRTMAIGQRQYFSAMGYDQFNDPMNVDWLWSATGGTVDSAGLYIPAETGSHSVSVTDVAGTVLSSASVDIIDGVVLSDDHSDMFEGCTFDFTVDVLANDAGYGLVVTDVNEMAGVETIFLEPGVLRIFGQATNSFALTYSAQDIYGRSATANIFINVTPTDEVWYNGIDENCDGLDDYDQDGDGYIPDAYLPIYGGDLPGGDCDDTDPAINPAAPDFCDRIDNNCDNIVDNASCDDLLDDVLSGFEVITDGPFRNLIPISLSDCDEVTWTFSGDVLDTLSTVGSEMISIDLGQQTMTNACMTVTRYNIDGSTCSETICAQISSLKMLDSGSIRIYPNPTDGMLYIEIMDEKDIQDYILELFDQNGRRLMVRQSFTGSHIQTLDISEMPAGHYRLYLRTDDWHYHSPVVKM